MSMNDEELKRLLDALHMGAGRPPTRNEFDQIVEWIVEKMRSVSPSDFRSIQRTVDKLEADLRALNQRANQALLSQVAQIKEQLRQFVQSMRKTASGRFDPTYEQFKVPALSLERKWKGKTRRKAAGAYRKPLDRSQKGP
jgi:hypothetical protein